MQSSENKSVITLVSRIITAARTGDYAECSSVLNRFLSHLQKELSRGYIPVKEISRITYSLETMAQMQQMENWVAFADVLDYEFLPLWQRITENQETADDAGQVSAPPAN